MIGISVKNMINIGCIGFLIINAGITFKSRAVFAVPIPIM